MAVTFATLKTLHPEFAPVADARVTAFIEIASRRVSATQWGTKEDDGVDLLTCHLLAKAAAEEMAASANAPAGPITSETVGDISVTYESPQAATSSSADGSSDFASTSYGRAYMTLRREIFRSLIL